MIPPRVMADTDKVFILMRHAQSQANARELGVGYDSHLSEAGRKQAKEAADFIRRYYDVDAIISSPFRRCIETAAPLCEMIGATLRLEPLLHEFFNVEWFGDDLRDITFPELSEIAESYDCVGGLYDEGRWWPEIAERAMEVDGRLRQLSRYLSMGEYPGKTIVCVGHWASVASLAYAFKPDITIPEIGNASVTIIEQRGRMNRIVMQDYDGFIRDPTC